MVGSLMVGLGPINPVSGSAPPAYNVSHSVVSFSDSTTLAALGLPADTLTITTGLLNSSASSPFPPTPTGTARASIHDLSVILADTATSTTLLDISATLIESQSSVSGFGTLKAVGSTTIQGLSVSGTLIGAPIVESVSPPPNTTIFDAGGLDIVLNYEVPMTGPGVAGITTDAIFVGLTNLPLGVPLVNGDIILSQSQAEITGTAKSLPEPGSWALMLLGFGLTGLGLRSRRSITARM